MSSCKNSMRIEPGNIEIDRNGSDIVLKEYRDGKIAKRVRIVGDDFILQQLAYFVRMAVNRRVAYLARRIEQLKATSIHDECK